MRENAVLSLARVPSTRHPLAESWRVARRLATLAMQWVFAASTEFASILRRQVTPRGSYEPRGCKTCRPLRSQFPDPLHYSFPPVARYGVRRHVMWRVHLLQAAPDLLGSDEATFVATLWPPDSPPLLSQFSGRRLTCAQPRPRSPRRPMRPSLPSMATGSAINGHWVVLTLPWRLPFWDLSTCHLCPLPGRPGRTHAYGPSVAVWCQCRTLCEPPFQLCVTSSPAWGSSPPGHDNGAA